MNVIIPLCGNGVRFSELGYKTPKPLIKCLGKPIIYWVIDNLKIASDDVIIIPYNETLIEYCFEEEMRKRYKDFNIILKPLPNTKGAADTVAKSLDLIPHYKDNDPLLIIDGDTFYNEDIIKKSKEINGSGIFYFIDQGSNPIFSYIKLNEENDITNIKEKIRISNNANIGSYKFTSKQLFTQYFKELKQSDGEIYISNVYERMVGRETIKGIKVKNDDFTCLGTPQQLKSFSVNKKNGSRVCFDLDNTLVTRPTVSGDYTTVKPIKENINYLRFLKDSGCEIIIHTARRMLTHNGNIGKILQDVGQITFNTLTDFDIPYDEIVFGKPYADFYIDDKSISVYDDMEKEIGYYQVNKNETRKFNNIVEKTYSTVVKESLKNDVIDGEIYYYKNIPSEVRGMFPKLIDYGENFYEIEKINGLTFSSLYTSKILNENHILNLLNDIKKLHQIKGTNDCHYQHNYNGKVKERYSGYDYSNFHESDTLFNEIIEWSKKYTIDECCMIHGDLVFTNTILDEYNTIKMIDMRGKLGDDTTIYGDSFYDYAKIYQSLIGYDFILSNTLFDRKYSTPLISFFEDYIINHFGDDSLNDIKFITKTLLFTLIPLHDDDKCIHYYNLIKEI